MAKRADHSILYRSVVSILESGAEDRKSLIAKCVETMGFSREELADRTTNSKQNVTRSKLGAMINEMLSDGIIAIDDSGKYHLVATKPVAVRLERCESEIFKVLTVGYMLSPECALHTCVPLRE